MKIQPLALLLFASSILAACKAGQDYVAPKIDAPQAWNEPAPGAVAAPDAWWTTFGDRKLVELVQRAASANTDLRVAVERLREARAQRGFASAQLWPRVDANGSYSNSRFSENGFLQGFGGGGLPGAVGPGQEINLTQGSLDATWELDVFGGRRRELEAREAEVASATFGVADALVSIEAEVAYGYVELRGAQARLAIAREMVASQQRTLDIVREQTQAGVASEFDRTRAETALSNLASRVPDLDGAVHVAIRRLETLLGALPGTLDAELTPVADVPRAPDALAVGIPSDVVRRRPDVRAAERRLAAATARIGAAKADYLPRFSLTASFGLQSQSLNDFTDWASRFWSIGPSVRWPLLDFGRVRAEVAVADARTGAALAEYEGAVVRALSDVETALVRLARERARYEQLMNARTSARSSVDLAESLYTNGVLEFTDLLDTQRTLHVSEDLVEQSDIAIATDTITLFKALGGGWQDTGIAVASADSSSAEQSPANPAAPPNGR